MNQMKKIFFVFCLISAMCITAMPWRLFDCENQVSAESNEVKPARLSDYPMGTATPAEACGVCHRAIYREYATGFGGDLNNPGIVYQSGKEKPLTMPANVSATGTAHALSGVDPFPIHARGIEEEERSCNVCHYPEAFDLPSIDNPEVVKPKPRPTAAESVGLTCASCHLTPEGKIRGPYEVKAPHAAVSDQKMQTAAMCAYCHALGTRVVGKQTQTFLEWRDDFHRPGLGKQHCQDCHMPRTLRKVAENFDVPVRPVARHLWTGGHSTQRIRTALNLVIVQVETAKPNLELHIINIGAGHAVPTGSNRRGIYLVGDVVDRSGKIVMSKEWMFAPWYGNRPDSRAFLEEDKVRPDAKSAMQADAQGPHEEIVRAGEERIIIWNPNLKPGDYTINGRLIYDLNRYNEKSFSGDQTEIYRASLPIKITQSR
jgi:hypothetical protein